MQSHDMSEDWPVTSVQRQLLNPQGLADSNAIYRAIRAAANVGATNRRLLFRYEVFREALYDRTQISDCVASILRTCLPMPVRT